MPKNEDNIQKNADFISNILEKNFKQKVKPKKLRAAAEKLCDAIPPARSKKAA